jgi:hypothetical protein
MTNLPKVIKVSSPRPELPAIIKVDGKIFKVKG